MALEIVVDSLEAVAETLREEYEPHGEGKFILKAVKAHGYESPDQVKGLKSALEKERQNVGSTTKQLQAMKDQLGGMDPAKVQELVAAEAKRAEDAAKAAGEWDKLKAQIVDQNTKALSDKDAVITGLQAALNAQLVDAEAVRVVAEEKGNQTLLMPHIKTFTRVIEVNGKHVVQVVDETGNPRVDAKGEPLTIKALVQEMRTKEVFAGAFAGSGNSGGGAAPNANAGGGTGGTGGKPAVGLIRSKMSVAEKAAYIGEHGVDKFMLLPHA